MTPAEHITRAEQLLETIDNPNAIAPWSDPTPVLGVVISHVLIAVAVELGAPHPTGTGWPGAGGS